jgi:hypothetical protein
VSPASWNYEDSIRPQGPVAEHLVLHPLRYQAAEAQPNEALYRHYVTEDAMCEQLMVRVERDVHTHKLLTDTHTAWTKVTVPWSCSVTVAIPQPWYRRLLRRPVRYVHKQTFGQVKAHVQVEVHAEHYAAFPDLPHYSQKMGEPIMVSMWRDGDGATRRRQTFPADGASEVWE